jgi:hypothetical protein
MTIETIIGVILIVTNVPVGWGGALLCGYYGKKTGKKFFYVLSGIIYVLSWGMLSLGVFLCGKTYARHIIENYVEVPVIIICIGIILVFVYRKKIFKKYKKDKN